MADIIELLESELKAAFDVKDERSLHNYVTLLVHNVVQKGAFMATSESLKDDIRTVVETMREGFARMDERFKVMDERFRAMDERFRATDERFRVMDERFRAMNERFRMMDKRFDDLIHQMDRRFDAMDKRFEDLINQMNSRFTMMFFFVSAAFTILTVLMTLYRFVG